MLTLWALSGFLGLPSDWVHFTWDRLIGVDLHQFSVASLSEWAAQFNTWVETQGNGPNSLMGYSLGGRLALHALIDRPDLWRGAVIISGHPGLVESHAKEERMQADARWAERFLKEDWEFLMQAWNAQSVFSGESAPFERQERDYDREQLSRWLIEGSLGRQKDLREPLAALQLPLLWVTGSLDVRFSEMAQTLNFAHPLSRKVEIPQAGHRLPWTHPTLYAEHVQSFLQELHC